MQSIKDKTAIVGIGATDFSKKSGHSELYMACETIKAAIDDAGLKEEDIDGMIKETTDPTDDTNLLRTVGIQNLTYSSTLRWGSGASCGLVLHAAMAVAAGTANNVICYRSISGSTGEREAPPGMGRQGIWSQALDLSQAGFYPPFGLVSREGQIAMIIRRYMHEFGITKDQFGWAPVVCRENAARNPRALFYKRPITIEEYRSSEMIVEPIRSLDCCEDVDGAVAVIVTTAEKARNLKQRPAFIMAAAQGTAIDGELMTSYNQPVISGLEEVRHVGDELFRIAGISAKDIGLVQLDDTYGPLIPMQLEELGFCARGEGAAFCEGGNRIRLDGELPLNTAGGSLGEGQMYVINHIAEAVRQIRGTSVNQVRDVNITLVAGGAGGPASGLILRR